jgi:hypothetical protein
MTETAKNETSLSVIENMNLNQVKATMGKISQFQSVVQNTLKKDHDYGAIPGCGSKPTLLKPGAEKILMLMGVSSQYELIERVQDYDKGFFAYTVKCILSKNGTTITEGMGHCNTMEKKYASERQDAYTLANTCLKMAKKRAQVDATLTIAGLSEIFTQDIEDMGFSNTQADGQQGGSSKEITYETAANMTISFGKHKGSKLKDIPEDYIQWLVQNAKKDDLKRACIVFLDGPKEPKWEEVDDADLPFAMDDDTPTEGKSSHFCQSCGLEITKARAMMSEQKYGQPYCTNCKD